LDQIRWMGNHGHSAWLLAREDSAIYREAMRGRLPASPIPFRGSANPLAIVRLIQFIKNQDIQLLDCHSASAASAALAARLFGKPIVQTFHYDFKADLVHKYLCRCGSDHIITVSHWIADKLAKLKFAERSMLSVIPTGIDLIRFNPFVNHQSFRTEFNIPDKTAVISVIGMIRPDKGQKYFIRAVDRIANVNPETRFLIVGSPTRTEYLNDIKKEIAAIHHQDKVILTGFRQDTEEIIAASDVIVNSSIFEPRSQVIHQAFAMKKLVIASDAGGNKESISHGETGFLFHSGNSENLSKTILTVLGNDTGTIRERAYRTVVSEFGIDVMMEKTLHIYHGVVKPNSHCRAFNALKGRLLH